MGRKGLGKMEHFIEVNGVSKSFKVSKRTAGVPGMLANLIVPRVEIKKAVDNISFHIEQGEMVGFIGPNGAGKSTVVKMLSGILCPDEGSIRVAGFIPYKQRKSYVRNIGVVFGQKSQLQWDLPVCDSFELLRAIYGVPEEVYRSNLKQFVEMLDMDKFINQPVRQLSLGQRMRADVAAALLHSPDIVFFDEPTIGVDVVGKEMIRSFIKELNQKKNITMLFTTHDMQDIEKTCNRLMIIDQGSQVYDGTLESIRREYGKMRRIDVEFNFDTVVDAIPNVTVENVENEGQHRKRFVFENGVVKMNELMNHILSKYSVKDIKVTEPDIEEIIRGIYRKEVV